MTPSQRGFNRIEILLIVICVLSLAAVGAALVGAPAYREYQIKKNFSTVIAATSRYQLAIELCAKFAECASSGSLSGLAEGTLGIPDSTSGPYLASVWVGPTGIITATATKADGLAGETYVLTPTYVKGAPIAWAVSGTCKTRPTGAIC